MHKIIIPIIFNSSKRIKIIFHFLLHFLKIVGLLKNENFNFPFLNSIFIYYIVVLIPVAKGCRY